jgi:hypothetical protein
MMDSLYVLVAVDELTLEAVIPIWLQIIQRVLEIVAAHGPANFNVSRLREKSIWPRAYNS